MKGCRNGNEHRGIGAGGQLARQLLALTMQRVEVRAGV